MTGWQKVDHQAMDYLQPSEAWESLDSEWRIGKINLPASNRDVFVVYYSLPGYPPDTSKWLPVGVDDITTPHAAVQPSTGVVYKRTFDEAVNYVESMYELGQ